MAVTLWMMLLCLLMHGSFCTNEHIERGCLKWSLDKTDENNVCCDVCRPGNRLVKTCGPSPEELCTPCKPDKFTVQPNSLKCSQCTQCVGAQILLEKCTATRDTVCGCKEGLMCGDDQCSFCVTACVNGTFYDQMQQRCKPWSTRCRNPDQVIVAKGDAFSDIKCEDATASADNVDTLVWALLPGMVILLLLIIIFSVTLKLQQEKKSEKPTKLETPVIGTPTDNDDHMTLIAIECSFHEAEQEQGSSLESLVSENSTKELIE